MHSEFTKSRRWNEGEIRSRSCTVWGGKQLPGPELGTSGRLGSFQMESGLAPSTADGLCCPRASGESRALSKLRKHLLSASPLLFSCPKSGLDRVAPFPCRLLSCSDAHRGPWSQLSLLLTSAAQSPWHALHTHTPLGPLLIL